MTERTFWMGEQSLKATPPAFFLVFSFVFVFSIVRVRGFASVLSFTVPRLGLARVVSSRQPSHPVGAPSNGRTAAGPRHLWRPWVVEQGHAGGVMPAPLGGMWLRRLHLSRYAYPVCTRAPSGP